MATETVAGSVLSISAAAPATFTATGYEALTWVPVGEMNNMGSVEAKTFNTSTSSNIGTALQTNQKASYTLPNSDFNVNWDPLDEGQILVQAATDSLKAVYSFKLERESGEVSYCTAQVMQFAQVLGGIDDTATGQFTLLRQSETIRGPSA
jgi:hypothetical protein